MFTTMQISSISVTTVWWQLRFFYETVDTMVMAMMVLWLHDDYGNDGDNGDDDQE